MPRENLTDRTLKALKPAEEGKRYERRDSIVPGLLVRVTETGKRTFMLQTRFPGSTDPTRRALGEYNAVSLEAAREKARKWIELISKGIDRATAEEEAKRAELTLRANTFAAVAEDYLRLHVIGPNPEKPRQRCGGEVERDLRLLFIPVWGDRPITTITKGDVLGLIEGVRDVGTLATLAAYGKGPKAEKKPSPGQARNVLGYIKTLFNWAAERDTYGLQHSPCTSLRAGRIIGDRQSGDRTLNDLELFAFCRGASRMPYPFGPVYRLLLLTALRLNEVVDASWGEFDLAKGMWIIPAARMKGKNGKARPHTVPLTADILSLLSELPRFNGGDYLFSSTNGATPVWLTNRAKKRIDARMTLTLRAIAQSRGEDPAMVKLPAWVNHDLRRTVRSRLSELRVDADVAEAVLAHVKPGIRGVYDRYELLDEKRHALELWATRLCSTSSSQSRRLSSWRRRYKKSKNIFCEHGGLRE